MMRELAGRWWFRLVAAMLVAASDWADAAPLDRLEFTRMPPVQANLSSVAFGGGRFVAVSRTGAMLNSVDGLHWTSQTPTSSGPLVGVVYGGGQFVAVGSSGAILSSSNGVNWTRQTIDTAPGKTVALQSVTYGDGLYVAVGSGGTIVTGTVATVVTSTNGIAWVSHAAPSPQPLTAVAFGNGRFVATAGTNVLVSEDALTWDVLPVLGSRVAFGNGVFVVNSPTRTSSDGIHWSAKGPTGFFTSLGFAGGQFVAFANGQVLLSVDGTIWTTINLPSVRTTASSSITYGNGRYVSVGGSSIFTSEDATDWAMIGAPGIVAGPIRILAFADGQFVAAGSLYPSPVWFSDNGLAWTPADVSEQELRGSLLAVDIASGNELLVILGGDKGVSFMVRDRVGVWTVSSVNLSFNALAFGRGKFVVVGNNGVVATSTNALLWTVEQSGTTNRLTDVTFAEDRFVAVGDRGSVLASTNGVDWLLGQAPKPTNLLALEHGDGLFVAVGQAGAILTSPNGLNWTAQVSPTTGILRKVAFGNELFVAIADSGTVVVSPDGVNWTRKSTRSTDALTGVAYGNGKFMITSATGMWEADLAPGLLDAPTFQNRQFSFSVTGELGQVYRVQAASNLTGQEWVDIGSVTNSHLSTPFIEPLTANQANRFYRLFRASTPE